MWIGGGLAPGADVVMGVVAGLASPDAPNGFGLSNSRVRVAGGGRRLRVFAVIQITASFLLLAGAAMLLTTLLKLETTQPGFETAHVLAVNLPLVSDGRPPAQIREFHRE